MNLENKKIFVLTGQRGIGKSTVCRRVSESLRDKKFACGGFISYKSRDIDIIIENVGTGESMILASRKPEYHGPRVGKYYFNSQALDFGLKALKKGLSADVIFIDELGRLEVKGEGFAAAFDYLRPGAFSCAVAVIREELLPVLASRFLLPIEIIRVDKENRDDMADQLVSFISRCITTDNGA